MSSENPEVVRKWQQPTAKQRLSHRSILRFVELADQLARDLSTLLLPEGEEEEQEVLGVYFVSADRHRDLEPDPVQGGSPLRYYNLRLLKTFRLLDDDKFEKKPIKEVWEWIKRNRNYERFTPLFKAADYLEGHSRCHYTLFAKCIEEANADDRQSEKQQRDIAERAHDLLVEAIAAMPYMGLLPSSLDQWFYGEGWVTTRSEPVLFKLDYGAGKVFFTPAKIEKKPLEKDTGKLIPAEAFTKVPSGSHADELIEQLRKDLGELYLKSFINWFTLGLDPAETDPVKLEASTVIANDFSPYPQVDDQSKNIDGFALPIYHTYDKEGNPMGGFEGWAIIHGGPYQKAFDKIECQKAGTNLAFRAFSRRVREERMRELLEKEWLATSDRRTFTLHHFQEFDGWITEERRHQEPPALKHHWHFEFLAEDAAAGENEISFTRYDNESPGSPSCGEITHIAVLPPNDPSRPSSPYSAVLLFRKREDTIVPSNHNDLVDYGFHITQAVGQIYNAARLKERAMETATQVLAKDFAHQVRHIAGALSGGWIIKESSFRKLLETNADTTPLDVRVAPIPALYQYADDVLVLWSTQRAGDLYDNDLFLHPCISISAILSVAAARAKSEWIAWRAKSYSLHLPGRIAEVRHWIEEGGRLERECDFSQIVAVELHRDVTQESNDKLLAYARLFEALVFNAFRHGEGAVTAIWNKENPQTICLQNRSKNPCRRSNDGEAVIQNLAKHAGVDVSVGQWKDGQYSRCIINTNTPWTLS